MGGAGTASLNEAVVLPSSNWVFLPIPTHAADP